MLTQQQRATVKTSVFDSNWRFWGRWGEPSTQATFPTELAFIQSTQIFQTEMWIVNSDPCFFPNAQPNYWQVFEGANQRGLLIISEHQSLWWGMKKAFICSSGPAPNCKHQEHPKKVHQPGLLELSDPTSHCSHSKYHSPVITKAVSTQGLGAGQKTGQCGRNFRFVHLRFVLGISKWQECFTSRHLHRFKTLIFSLNSGRGSLTDL